MPVRWVAEGDVMARGASQSFVGVLVPSQQRSIHAMVAQSLKETEALINRLEARGAGGRQWVGAYSRVLIASSEAA